jgi:hypothetical protein
MFGRLFQRIIIEVRIPSGRCRLGVTKQFADDRQPQSGTGSHRRMRMTQIMNTNPSQASAFGNGLPRLL